MKTNKRSVVLIVNEERTFVLPDLDLRITGWINLVQTIEDGKIRIEIQRQTTDKHESSKNRRKLK